MKLSLKLGNQQQQNTIKYNIFYASFFYKIIINFFFLTKKVDKWIESTHDNNKNVINDQIVTAPKEFKKLTISE
jgi:hypothetical protein